MIPPFAGQRYPHQMAASKDSSFARRRRGPVASTHWQNRPGLRNNRSQGQIHMTSYRSRGLDGPEPTWKGTLFLLLLILTIAGAAVLAFH